MLGLVRLLAKVCSEPIAKFLGALASVLLTWIALFKGILLRRNPLAQFPCCIEDIGAGSQAQGSRR